MKFDIDAFAEEHATELRSPWESSAVGIMTDTTKPKLKRKHKGTSKIYAVYGGEPSELTEKEKRIRQIRFITARAKTGRKKKV